MKGTHLLKYLTKPKPLLSLVRWSFGMYTSPILPYLSKRPSRSSVVVLGIFNIIAFRSLVVHQDLAQLSSAYGTCEIGHPPWVRPSCLCLEADLPPSCDHRRETSWSFSCCFSERKELYKWDLILSISFSTRHFRNWIPYSQSDGVAHSSTAALGCPLATTCWESYYINADGSTWEKKCRYLVIVVLTIPGSITALNSLDNI